MARFTIDAARSRIGFSVRHLVVSKVRGRFTRFTGSIVLDDAALAGAQVEARIEVASVESGDRERDEYLRTSEFLDPARHPELIFLGRRVEQAGRKLTLRGDLTIRGVTREVALAVEPGASSGGRRAFRATTSIDRRDFDLRWGQLVEAGGIMVGDKIEIEIAIEAAPAPHGA